LSIEGGRAERITGFHVTAGFFGVLGLRPARGREFAASDELPANGRVVIVSDHLWHATFGGDPNIVGRKLILDSQPFTVVGVMPPGTEHPGNSYRAVRDGETVDLWWPVTFEGDGRGSHYVDVVARMKPGIGLAQAQSDVDSMIAQLAREHSQMKGW